MKKNLILPLLLTAFLFLQPEKSKAQVDVQDSLALVDFYNSTDGRHWKNRENWLTGQPVRTWYGVSVENDRVISISMYDNYLKGALPSSLGNLTGLTELYFIANKLSGNIPHELGNLPELHALILDHNKLSGNIPPELSKCKKLATLALDKNQLSGNIPPELGYLPELDALILSNNELSGAIPPELGKLIKLYFLNLENNQLSGNIPPELGKLINILDLTMENNQLSGNIPPELGNLNKSFRRLYLNNNHLTGNIPPELGKLTGLLELQLNSNQLIGNIPRELGDLDLLKYLALYDNELTGIIPKELSKLTRLKYLYLHSNQLRGGIPSSFGKLKNLVILDLKSNKLKDSIPSNLGNLGNLQSLMLSHNKLRGNIPSSFSNLHHLIILSAGDNILSGEVLSFLGKLPALKKLNLLHNHYTFDGLEALVENNNFDVLKYQKERIINLHQTGSTLSVSAGGTLNNNTYKWYKDGALVSTINGDSTFTPTVGGKYNVEVTNSIATKLTLYSDTVAFSALAGVQQNNIAALKASDKPSFSIYPNPAKTNVTVSFTLTGKYTLKLTDVNGTVLQKKTGTAVNNKNTLQLDVSKYVAGVYFVTISNEKSETKTLRFIRE